MKKNVMMRIASILLVCVLATTCGISGTFAKYVTEGSGADTARVAKFGVTIAVNGGAFAKEYEIKETANDVNGDAIEMSVASSNEDKVVAPGTSGTFTGVALTGTPEVAVNVNHEATITLQGWTLASGEFYCPIKITIENTAFNGLDYDSATEFVTALEGAIEAANGNYQTNTNLAEVEGLNGDYTWEWAFENGHADQTDAKDTELGNQAARGTLNTITIEVKTTVTQID